MLLIQKDGYSSGGVQKTAQTFYVSVSYLSHLFKEKTGLSFLQYAKLLKLDKAKNLIEQGHQPIKEIATIAGYKESKRLIHDFKAAYGLTPRQYRKRIAADRATGSPSPARGLTAAAGGSGPT
jgi:two-component system response regulator YesN